MSAADAIKNYMKKISKMTGSDMIRGASNGCNLPIKEEIAAITGPMVAG
jgi:hypothetical protein